MLICQNKWKFQENFVQEQTSLTVKTRVEQNITTCELFSSNRSDCLITTDIVSIVCRYITPQVLIYMKEFIYYCHVPYFVQLLTHHLQTWNPRHPRLARHFYCRLVFASSSSGGYLIESTNALLSVALFHVLDIFTIGCILTTTSLLKAICTINWTRFKFFWPNAPLKSLKVPNAATI